MNAIVIHDEKLKSSVIKHIKNNNIKIIIVTFKELYYEIEKLKLANKCIYIELASTDYTEETLNFTHEIIDSIKSSNSKVLFEEYDLLDITINELYDNFTKIVLNYLLSLERVISNYAITSLYFSGGHPDVEFVALTLSEGERAFKFLYKRAWFLNYYANYTFNEYVSIKWLNKTPKFTMNLIRLFRNKVIFFGKLISLIRRVKSKKRITEKDNLLKSKNIIMLIVRNPIQVEPLIPIYNEIKNSSMYLPVYVAFENYSNNTLNKELEKKDMDYIDLYKYLDFAMISKALKHILAILNEINSKEYLNLSILNNKIRISVKEIVINLTIYFLDLIIFKDVLDSFEKSHNNMACIINNETDVYQSALEGEWIRRRNKKSFGIQHVSIPNINKPKVSRVDTMFMMDKKIAEELSEIKADEKFEYYGPMAYDLYFNTSLHSNKYETISIFTQPDDYKDEYIKIINDIINICKKNNLRFNINVKLHPREKDAKTFKNLINENNNYRVFENDISSSELIAKSDLVISIHSGVLMQAIIIGTPGVSVNYNNKYLINYDFVNDDVTKKIRKKEELELYLKDLLNNNKCYLENRTRYLNEKLPAYSGRSSKKIFDYIQMQIE